MRRALVIDGQLFQSLAFHRGIGKYSMGLLEELEKTSNFYDLRTIIFNQNGLHDEDLRSIKKIIPSFEIKFLPLGLAGAGNYLKYSKLEAANKKVLDQYINTELMDHRVDFLILSLFQDAEVSTFPSRCGGKYLIVYDLIPIEFPEYYIHDPYTRKVYLSRFKVLNEADHFFTISRTVANDVAIHLGVPPSRVTPILGAQIKRKRIKTKTVKELEGQQYILMPSGDDPRKNNSRAVMAFEEFNKNHNNAYKLVITSFFGERIQQELKAYCQNIYFSGNVSENELSWLYENAKGVFFASEAEGLGLPVLEAVEFNKPVACSAIDVFKEISQDAFVFCDPYDIASMSAGLREITTEENKINKADYNKILKDYDWRLTAQKVTNILRQALYQHPPEIKKPKIAIFTSRVEGFAATGKLTQEQHYQLSRVADVDYYLSEGLTSDARNANIRPSFLEYAANCYSPWQFNVESYEKYHQVIHHIGNSEYYVPALIKALTYPDTVIVHDTNVQGLYEAAKAFGYIDEPRYIAEKSLQELSGATKSQFLVSLLRRQKRVIVHSEYAASAAKEITQGSDVEIVRIDLAASEPYFVNIEKPGDEVIVAMAGIVHEAKGLELVEEITKIPRVTLKIFGFSLLSQESEERIKYLPNVQIIQSPSDGRFLYELENSDVVLNYRLHYHGETSLSTIEALRLGKVVIVNNTGWFDELPDDIVCKVDSKEKVVSTIETIIKDTKYMALETQQKRIDYTKTHHGIKNYLAGIIRTT